MANTKVSFSADDKIINQNNDTKQLHVENPAAYFEIDHLAEQILQNQYSVIALQFPDELMSYASYVSTVLEKLTKQKIYILADTSYGSCCIDEVAASHYNANVIIHFGQSCLSNPEKTPVIYIFGRAFIDCDDFLNKIKETFTSPEEKLLLFFDVQYSFIIGEHKDKLLSEYPNLVLTTVNTGNNGNSSTNDDVSTSCMKFGRKYELKFDITDYKILFVGDDGRTLYNLMISYNKNKTFSYNPETKILRQEELNVNRYLMRRYYLIEKAKDAQIVGIMMGTLGVAKYGEMVDRLKKVLKTARKKFYTFVVGKVNPAKLANFMEIDMFVLVACPENSLIDSKEFYKPIVTPFEMEIACLKSRSWTGEYVTDFRDLLPGSSFYVDIESESQLSDDEPEYSFITGKLKSTNSVDTNCTEVVLCNQDTTVALVQATTAAEYLSSRLWQGLQVESGKTEVVKVVEGRSGIAMNYVTEPEQ